MNKLFTILLLCVTVSVNAQLTKIGNWNAYVHNPGVKAPLLIAFHGDGQAGAVENLTKKDGLAVLLKAGWRPPYTYFIVCPQSPSGSFPDKDIPTLLKLIAQKYPNADTTGYRTTGFSSGAKTCLEGVVHKPGRVLVLSAAGGGASLVNFIAQNKIPITHWTGSNESDHINWTLYQINQKVPGLCKTIVRQGYGHSDWNLVYQSEEFWNYLKPAQPAPLPLKDTVLNRLGSFDLPSGNWTWTVIAKTEEAKLWGLLGNRLSTMENGTWLLTNGLMEYRVTFIRPKPVEPTLCYTIRIGKITYTLYSHPDKNIYRTDDRNGMAIDFEMKCGDKTLTIKKDFTWVQD